MPQNKILIVAPSWVGDMVMAQALFKHIKHQSPAAQIDVVAPEWSHDLLARMPEITQCWTSPCQHGELGLAKRYQLGKRLRREQYNQAIVLPNSFKSALIPFWAQIPRRTGWVGECRYGLLNDRRTLNKKALPLMVSRFLALGVDHHTPTPAYASYAPQLHTTKETTSTTVTALTLSSSQQPTLALCPGAAFGPAKRWPTAYFGQVAQQKISDGWQVWILGGKNDQVLAEEILKHAPGCIDLTGKTTLANTVDLLASADVTISNDSGLMHIAASVNTKLIALYGSSSPDFTPPLNDQAHILCLNHLSCRPCFQRTCPLQHFKCMLDLTPDKILSHLTTEKMLA